MKLINVDKLIMQLPDEELKNKMLFCSQCGGELT